MRRSIRSAVPLLLGAASLVLAACGSSSKDKSTSSSSTPAKPASSGGTSSGGSPAGGASTVSLNAIEPGQPEYTFDKKKLSGTAGTVTLTMTNLSKNKNPHGIAIEGNGVDKDGQVVQPGSDSTVTLDLKPGKYTYYCPVPGHRQEGMQGTLTIK